MNIFMMILLAAPIALLIITVIILLFMIRKRTATIGQYLLLLLPLITVTVISLTVANSYGGDDSRYFLLTLLSSPIALFLITVINLIFMGCKRTATLKQYLLVSLPLIAVTVTCLISNWDVARNEWANDSMFPVGIFLYSIPALCETTTISIFVNRRSAKELRYN